MATARCGSAGPPRAISSYIEPILEQTETLQLATGIVNVWTAPADEVAEAYHRVENAYPGRFLLGIGIGHPEHTDEYRKPYDVLVEYLDALDAAKVPTSRRVVAALGPKVLKLAAQRSAGAHPYLTTPEHTGQARELVGPTVYLAPEHKVVLTTDANEAREIGRQTDRLLPEPEQLPEQLEAARVHGQGRRQTRQRPPDRRSWSPTAPPTTSPPASTSTSMPGRTTSPSRCSAVGTSCCRRSRSWRARWG